MHDNCLVEYSVNLKEKKIIIQTYDNKKKKYKRILFYGVLTHSFKCIIDYNIIMDIQEYEAKKFLYDNEEEIVKLKDYCWPTNYQNEKELIDFLITNEYKYIKISSSYGMFGWILAKSYEIKE